jgi:hypothetical protein
MMWGPSDTGRMTRPRQDFWAITSYYNLTESARRLRNYRCFKRRLSEPLLTVEWHPDSRFQLNDNDADIVLRVGGGDLMWQKERLLSLAVAALPDTVKYVAWLDCDVLFENRDWADESRELLKRNRVVQLFGETVRLTEDESLRLIDIRDPELDGSASYRMPTKESFLAAFGRLKDDIVHIDLNRRFQPHAMNSIDAIPPPAGGLAWAAQSSFLREAGFYERCIVGGGDTQFCYGITGLGSQLIDTFQALGWAYYADCQTYRDWAARATAACSGRLGCVGGRLLHLFHGSSANRQYHARKDGLVPFALDLDRDIVAEDGQPWSWRRDRDRLNAYFLSYMRARKEDDEIATSRFELARS